MQRLGIFGDDWAVLVTNLGCICDDLGCVGDEFGDDLGSFDNALWIVPGVTARFDSLIIRLESEDILKFST